MKTEEAVRVGLAFGRAVKIKRVEIGLTQEDFAEKTGLARSFVSGIERGAAKASTVTVWRLADGLGCLPSQLWQVAERLYISSPNATDVSPGES
ncbi:XRE family transcriptional regulator [Marinobacter sp. CP1]|jgi:transcriptional regulator with XRE-family HTH domain|uniref:helix-turn-helix domain-containing protein n=1 Tax=unclassified Marinobacter TaxID=83889 RepID=UPI00069E5602|nr:MULTISPECIES: helix-turn-helix transcriptional regulator [unclassified Marinobacter]AKV98782.1 XRE family transcriptional regulator [Marinobacter sp. CP1]